MKTYTYTQEAVTQHVHTCARCGVKMQVRLHAIGSSGAIPDHVDTLAARERALAHGLAADVRRTLPLVRCPNCRERRTLAVVLARARVGAWFAAVPVLPIIAPGPLEVLWVIPIGLAIAGFAQLLRERSRFARAAAASVLQLTAPTRKPTEPVRRVELPAARATKVPAATRTPLVAPPPPVVALPPPVVTPRELGLASKPQFLTERQVDDRDPSRS